MTGFIMQSSPGHLDRCSGAVAAWLDEKFKRSQSARTVGAYNQTMAAFRESLRAVGLDLDSPDLNVIALAAQAWAGQRAQPQARPIAGATYNQRLAVIASFYVYALRMGLPPFTANPVDRITRATVGRYQGAVAISGEELAARLAAIDRTTLVGLRDHALLSVGLNTGCRASELAGLRREDVSFHGPDVTLYFTRTKGGKTRRHTRGWRVANTLREYGAMLDEMALDAPLVRVGDAGAAWRPLWVGVSRRWGARPLTIQGVADICKRHLGTSQTHTLRHSYAVMLDQSGASLREIQQALGHASATTTEQYLGQFRPTDHAQADLLADVLRI